MGVAEEDLRDEYGMDWNPRADDLDTPFTGRKATASWLPFDGWNNRSDDMYSSTLINERENYFHKPIVQLNSYNKLNDTMTLASSLLVKVVGQVLLVPLDGNLTVQDVITMKLFVVTDWTL